MYAKYFFHSLVDEEYVGLGHTIRTQPTKLDGIMHPRNQNHVIHNNFSLILASNWLEWAGRETTFPRPKIWIARISYQETGRDLS